jgi:hypothetical protein
MRTSPKLGVGRGTMSHSGALFRLTVGDRRSDMSRWARSKRIDKFEQEWNVLNKETHPFWIMGENL